MKKSIIVIILMSFILTCNLSILSQETKEFNTKKTEVNIGVANIFAKNQYLYTYYYWDQNGYYVDSYYSDYIDRPELVLGVKFHTTSGAYRLSTNFRYSNITEKDKNNPSDKETFKFSGLNFNMGYEWHLTFKRVNIYYGFDISTTYSSMNYITESNSEKNETKYNQMSFGVSPLLGTNVFILTRLSIGTEVKFITEYISGKTEYKREVNPDSSGTKSSGFRTRFGPLGFISVNLHF